MRHALVVVGLGLILAGCQMLPPMDTDTRRIEVRDVTPDPERPPEPGRVPRRVAFSEAEYRALPTQGTARLSGQLFYDGPGGRHYGRHETVSIAPVTAYSAEAAEQALAGRAVERADPRAQAYTHRVRTDGQGRFEAAQLPPGDFYVSGSVGLPNGERSPLILHQIRLRNGQTTRVNLRR
ncbi:carboxypeptidase-like regulatory domain-containing protein [Halomonas salifodinae]|uniref:Carboxypeptidase-like regulatory domain-containing protein n=1 Tax=Halomonas salifodinae TaxID=438745 RepID=A0ABW2EYW2_9GAMM